MRGAIAAVLMAARAAWAGGFGLGAVFRTRRIAVYKK
jgi:hypothetical protein